LTASKQSKKDFKWIPTNPFQETFKKIFPKTQSNKKIESPQPPEESRVAPMLELTPSIIDRVATLPRAQISANSRATQKFTIYRKGKIASEILTSSRINNINNINSR
jgi:hypothetical protein